MAMVVATMADGGAHGCSGGNQGGGQRPRWDGGSARVLCPGRLAQKLALCAAQAERVKGPFFYFY